MASTSVSVPYRVLMVCMGNICRSPLAHGVLQHQLALVGLSQWVSVDSAGTHFYHVGCQPDSRSIAIASQYGVDITTQQARQVTVADFEQFDLMLAMDERNLADLKQLAGASQQANYQQKVKLLLSFSSPQLASLHVPDPYHEEADGFERTYQLVNMACTGLVAHLQQVVGVLA
jgi:protein-tyrosine phosphatase